MSDFRAGRLAAMRAKIAAIEAGGRSDSESLPFGDDRIDGRLPGGGLPLGRWHEIVSSGLEVETAAAPAAFTALLATPLAARGEVVWVLRRDDLWAPGLAGLGFPPEKLICVCARDEAEAVDLTAGRRLQLACEKRGATGFLIRRRPFGGLAKREAGGSAAATRWSVASAPSEPPAGEFGLGAPRFRARLERCRGGRTGAWLFEAPDAYDLEARDGTHPLRLVAELGDRQLAPALPLHANAA